MPADQPTREALINKILASSSFFDVL
jgi:hypothetical protein